jgi:hypothetical protein
MDAKLLTKGVCFTRLVPKLSRFSGTVDIRIADTFSIDIAGNGLE